MDYYWHNQDKKESDTKDSIWIIDYSFYIFNKTFGYRRRCSCWDDRKRAIKPGYDNCSKCNNERYLYMSANGHVTGGLYGFLDQCIARLREGYKVITVFDPPKEQLTRMKLLDTYKGNRPPTPEYITYQMDYGIKMLPHTDRIECYYSHEDESDDVMSTIALEKANQGHKVVVATDDKDMFPLLAHKNIELFRQKEIFNTSSYHDHLDKKYGIKIDNPGRFNEYLAICGDSADNFNLIKGLGPKAAEFIIGNYGSIIDVFDDLNSLPDKYRKKLVRSCDGSVCDKCLHMPSKDKDCLNRSDKVEYLKDELELSLKIATLETNATYERLKPGSDKKLVYDMLDYLKLEQAKQNINLLFES